MLAVATFTAAAFAGGSRLPMDLATREVVQPGPAFPRVIQHASLGCPRAEGCLLGSGHGCIDATVAGATNCQWASLAEAEAGCGAWSACGGLVCDSSSSGSCVARSWDSPLHTGAAIASIVYLRTPPSSPTPAPPSPTPAPPPPTPPTPPPPPPPYPEGFPPKQQPAPNVTGGGWTHGWDCIACPGNSMLSANLGTNDNDRFNITSPWWLEELATRYAHIQMSPFLGANFYNGTVCTPACLAMGINGCTCGEHPMKVMARLLKGYNPKMKVQLYQAVDRGDLSPWGSRQLQAHPDWWMRDDNGHIMFMNDAWKCPPDLNMSKINGTQQCHPLMDWSNEEYRAWFRAFPLSMFGDDAAALFDGLMVDGSGYFPGVPWMVASGNISITRYQQLFVAQIELLREAQREFAALNGGLIFDNGGLPDPGTQPTFPELSWRNVAGGIGSGSFLEWFGVFGQIGTNGSWVPGAFNTSMNTVMESARAGFPVVVKQAPGPADQPFLRRGYGADQGLAEHNGFFITQWKGPAGPISNNSQTNRDDAAAKLVQSLAPFLIVAEPNVFFNYGWFYNLEDGYIPCPGNVTIDGLDMPIECGMPTQWYPEFERPLGPPAGPAICTNGSVWTRRFEHAEVYMDLYDINTAKIDWK